MANYSISKVRAAGDDDISALHFNGVVLEQEQSQRVIKRCLLGKLPASVTVTEKITQLLG